MNDDQIGAKAHSTYTLYSACTSRIPHAAVALFVSQTEWAYSL